MGIKLLATGSAVPVNRLENKDFESFLDTSDEWITTRTGIVSRHIDTGEGATALTSAACEKAIAAAGIEREQIGLVICGTMTPDRIVPCLAAEVRDSLAIGSAVAFDINSACTGFITALITAAGMMRDLGIRYALVAGCDLLSRMADWEDRASCILFGDGAGAVLVECGGFDNLIACGIHGEKDEIRLLDCGSFWRDNRFAVNRTNHLLKMDGKGVFRFAVNAIAEEIVRICEKSGITPDKVDHYVPHQANLRIIASAAVKVGVPLEKFFINIERYGNTSSATVPIALDELNATGTLLRGQTVLAVSFGGGLSVGSALFRW